MFVNKSDFFDNINNLHLFIDYDGYVVTNKDWKTDCIYTPTSRLYLVRAGSGVLYSDREKIVLEPGYAYLAPCGMKYGYYGTPSVEKLFFHIKLFTKNNQSDILQNYYHFMKIPCEVKEIDTMKKLYFSDDMLDILNLKSKIEKIIYELLRTYHSTSTTNNNISGKIEKAIIYIKNNLRADLTVSEIANAVFCSRSNLSLDFKKEVSQSVGKYIEDLLMSEAETMLLYTDLSIKEISEKLGYCDQFYFSRRFTERFSVSPKKYKNTNRIK